MTILDHRQGYCEAKRLHPDSIPGRACLRGDYDDAPGFIEFVRGKA